MSKKPTMVNVIDLYKNYGKTLVLNGLTLRVAEGEVLVIIGPSGGGKSTLLRCLSNLEPINRGEILIGGKSRAEVGRGEVGMVFQQFNLFPHLTAVENVALAPQIVRGVPRRSAEEQAGALLRQMGLADKGTAYPFQLSGGQQQRVAIARSLAMNPKVILFDEVTSALDRELVREVLNVMRQLAADGMTMMVVTHELSFAEQVADRVAMIDGGVVVEEAPPAEFFSRPTHARTRAFLDVLLADGGGHLA